MICPGCGAEVQTFPTPGGSQVTLDTDLYAWDELPAPARWMILAGQAHRPLGGAGGSEAIVRVEHATVCPGRITRPPQALREVWRRHRDHQLYAALDDITQGQERNTGGLRSGRVPPVRSSDF
ncbi:MAG TPA: DUF6083 domain-containing protein [Candidatus Nanopelagicales bacterium]|jgi:hypothetical protein|nr:DUF6083 domain-containing protein [Candidatus Nanopelagicales bacterium]